MMSRLRGKAEPQEEIGPDIVSPATRWQTTPTLTFPNPPGDSALAQRAQIQVRNGTNLTNENFCLFDLFQSA